MNLFGMLEVSGSALAAERWRAEVVSANMANAETTRTPGGGAYRRQLVVFRARPTPRFSLMLTGLHSGMQGALDGGVRVDRVVADATSAAAPLRTRTSRCRYFGICHLSQRESGDGDDRPAQRGAGLPAQRLGGAGGQKYDSAVVADSELTRTRAGGPS